MKIYFAGKFTEGEGEAIFQRLENDYRAILLGDSKALTIPTEKISLKAYPVEFTGGFYLDTRDSATIVKERIKEIKRAGTFVCVLNAQTEPDTVSELIDACHFGKKIVIFYEKPEGENEKPELWYPIERAKDICKGKLEIISYKENPVPYIANYLTDILYKKLYASTIEFKRDNGEALFTYTYNEKEVTVYKKEDNLFAEEIYKTGLVVVKSLNSIKSDTLTKTKKNAPILGGTL